MSALLDENNILAFAAYELRLLLAGYLGSEATADPSVRVAAHLSYALHNQALAVLEGKRFSASEAEAAITAVGRLRGENFARRLSAAVDRAV